MALVHRDAIVAAYRDIFPAEAPTPTVDDLETDWAHAIADPNTIVLVGEATGDIVATVAVRADADQPHFGQVRRLHVVPARWGHGVGSDIHDQALKRLRQAGFTQAGLWVLEANHRARRMYERRGWRLCAGKTLEWPGLGVIEVRYERTL